MQQRCPPVTTRAIFTIALVAAAFVPAADAVLLRTRVSQRSNYGTRQGWATYLIASFPSLRQVNYAKLGDNVWRPLVLSGLVAPKSICVDQGNSQLYVADESANTVFRYQLKVEDGILRTDGRQYVAFDMMLSRALACDGSGNVYVAGRSVNTSAVPGKDSTEEAVLRQDADGMAAGNAPRQVWTHSSSGTPSRLTEPGSLAVDSTNLYWGNTASGTESGSLIKARREDSASMPEPLTFDTVGVHSIALTPSYVFYGTKGWIYGVRKFGKSEPCDSEMLNAGSGSCYRIAAVTDATGMAWDGEGTLFVADSLGGSILSLPSGSASPHAAKQELEAPGVSSIGLFQAESGARLQTQASWLIVHLQCVITMFTLSRLFAP